LITFSCLVVAARAGLITFSCLVVAARAGAPNVDQVFLAGGRAGARRATTNKENVIVDPGGTWWRRQPVGWHAVWRAMRR
jgi:hypothetical protein